MSFPAKQLRILTARIFASAALLGSAIGAHADAPIRIAPLPMESREATVLAFKPVVTYLQHQLGEPVEFVYFDKNSEIVKALQDKQLDVAMLGPLPYVSLRKRKTEVEPLVFFRESTGEASYRCVLVKASGDAVSLKALRGKRIALTQPLSTCGYLGANAILRQQAGITLEDMKYRYYNTHEAAALAVAGGDAEIAGIKDEFAAKFAPLGLVVVAQSARVPALGLFASRATLDERRIAGLRRILLATPEDTYRRWGNAMRHGMAPAADADFEVLRSFGDPGAIPGEGNAK